MVFRSNFEKIQLSFRGSSRYWPILLVTSLVLSYLASILYLTNPYGIFSARKLFLALAVLPVFYGIAAILTGRFLVPRLDELSRRCWAGLLIIAFLLSVGGTILFPAPQPDLSQPHQLRILVSTDANPLSTGRNIQIQKIQSLDGRRITPPQFQRDGDWQIVEDTLTSSGKAGSAVEWNGAAAGGISLKFKYQPDAGSVTIVWDGQESNLDLYTPSASVSETVLRGNAIPLSSPFQYLIASAASLLYFLGLFAVMLSVCLVFRLNLLTPTRPFVALAYVVFLGIFLMIRLIYPGFILQRLFRDTASYVSSAAIPITSLSFWAGERSFTLPLFYKILGIRPDWMDMALVFQWQLWVSIFCWTALASAAASSLRKIWIGPLAFILVLLYGANLEIGLWDSLLLTESLSISLFVLLLAMWIGWFSIPAGGMSPVISGLYLAGMILVSILYTFTRDSNLYFLLICTGVFLLALILRRKGVPRPSATWMYAAAMLGLAFVHTASLSVGNRWQIFLYDHLALRILLNPQATAYFANAGLPVNPELMQITGLLGYQYHDLLMNAPSMQPVRDWVNQNGKSAYFQYLLSRPLQTLAEPLQNYSALVNGSGMTYLYPRFLPLKIPKRVAWVTNLFFNHAEWSLLALFLLVAAASWLYWVNRSPASPLGLVISALLISVYPMMFVIWHGEPMEIQRHAIQIGIQIRLAGWLAVPLLVEAVLTWPPFRAWLDLPLQPVPVQVNHS